MMAFVLAAMILGLGWDSSGGRSPTLDDVSRWVGQLGDERFRVRESAFRELIRAGEMAIPAVRSGTRSNDPEVVARCQRLLPAILAEDRQAKLSRLLAPAGGRPPAGLPGLERFLSITGDTRDARQLYAEMLRNHHEIVCSIEDKPAATSKLLDAFGQLLHDRRTLALANAAPMLNGQDPPANAKMFEHPSELALFLFVRGDRRFKQLEEDGFELEMAQDPGLQQLLSGPKASALFRKLFVDWYQHEKRPLPLLRASDVAVKTGMRELLPVMIRCLKDEAVDAPEKAWFLNSIAALGDKALLEHVEPFLTDKTVVVSHGVEDEGGSQVLYNAQLGDVALNVCWKWAGQKPDEILTGNPAHNKTPSETEGLDLMTRSAFRDDQLRQAAHDKWKKLRSGMTKPEVKGR